ncbi:unnamed protein product [Protopolystoma xenopodis]|uniref:Chromodomain-helicase-DNA-binding protein 6-9 tri-helical domain-containing protein n=1 Tax=Protopolystoma xenopodis TaxID=117903 RepID=A0A3S5A5V1_9PLAT|nr:unnamed protein product [Protopolystoma xenopodis]
MDGLDLSSDELTMTTASGTPLPLPLPLGPSSKVVGEQPDGEYNWIAFRQAANLMRKSDAAITNYFHAFYQMCQRVCRKTSAKGTD